MKPKNAIIDFILPDLIIPNGEIVTISRNFSIAQALAIKSGKTVVVGTNDEIKLYQAKR
jgi:predicted amidohydrolase YtcJ